MNGGSKWSSGNTFAWQLPGRGFESWYSQKRKTDIGGPPPQKLAQGSGQDLWYSVTPNRLCKLLLLTGHISFRSGLCFPDFVAYYYQKCQLFPLSLRASILQHTPRPVSKIGHQWFPECFLFLFCMVNFKSVSPYQYTNLLTVLFSSSRKWRPPYSVADLAFKKGGGALM